MIASRRRLAKRWGRPAVRTPRRLPRGYFGRRLKAPGLWALGVDRAGIDSTPGPISSRRGFRGPLPGAPAAA
jgi:hypothetical protein